MDTKNDYTLKRRFPGFEGEWEQKKLGDIAEIYDGTHQTPRYTNKGVMFLSVENIKTLKSNKYISKDDFIKDFKIFPKNGDVLMTRIGDIGTSNVVNTDSELAFYVSLALIRSSVLDSNFLNISISSSYFQKELWRRTLHIAFPKKINKNEIGEVSVLFPCIAEQKQIGNFFKKLDQSITLQQQKLDKLKNLKRAYLSEMFPAEGELVPKRRFSGFEGEWERQKWMDTVNISTEMVDPSSGEFDNMLHIAPGNIESFTGRILDNIKTVKEEHLISGKFRFRAGDIVYGKINPQLGKYFFAKIDGLTSADAYVLNGINGTKQEFLYTILQSKDFFNYSVSVSKRSGMPKINREELNDYSYWRPGEAEQNKIGELFQIIDTLQSLQQQKLDKLNDLKKAYLNELFV